MRVKKLNEEFDTILLFSKTENFTILPPTRLDYKPDRWHGFDAAGIRTDLDYDLFGHKPPNGRHWSWTKDNAKKAIENYQIWEKQFADKETLGDFYRQKLEEGERLQFLRESPSTSKPEYFIPSSESSLCNNLWNDMTASSFDNDYPTEKSEKLLQRIIEATTEKDDLVLDFFGGSGTTVAVAEKLGRKWITCDIGKFSFYTMQKRLLTIQTSKSLAQPNKKYGRPARTFLTVNTGLYDIEKLNSLTREKYTDFVLNLFEVQPKRKKINGVEFHGERKDGYDVFVWDFWQDANAKVTEEYLETLHALVGSRSERFYIIAPANAVSFVGDYHEIDDTRYYFLKIPYQIINELHREPFARARQPRSKTRINDLDNAVGFHFMRQPDVECKFENGKLQISKFLARERNGNQEFENFEALAMLVVDANFNGRDFTMTDFHFAEDLKRSEAGEIVVPLGSYGERVVVAFVDLFGNEFKQEIKTG